MSKTPFTQTAPCTVGVITVQFTNMKFKELVEIFGKRESNDPSLSYLLRQKINEEREIINSSGIREYLIDLEAKQYDEFTNTFIKEVFKRFWLPDRVKQAFKNVRRLKVQLSIAEYYEPLLSEKNKSIQRKNKPEPIDVDSAREVSIEDVFEGKKSKKFSRGKIKCLCPFHQEKTPSFNIDIEKNLFHCFGCQAGGDVIEFVQKYYGLNFIEAVKFLNNSK